MHWNYFSRGNLKENRSKAQATGMTLTSTEGKVNQLKISESKVVRVFTVISKEVERGGGEH